MNDRPRAANQATNLAGQEAPAPRKRPGKPQRSPSSFERSMQFEGRPPRWRAVRIGSFFVLFLAISIPILLSAYYAYYATDRYVTISQFTVRSGSTGLSAPDAIASVTGVASASGMLGAFQDAFVVREFVHSQELVDKVDKELNLVSLFSRQDVDWWSRLNSAATREEKHDYWQYRVSADLDATTGLVTLTVSAFTSEDSLALSKTILSASQDLVNRLSDQARQDALSFASAEVGKAEHRLREIRMRINEFRKEKGDIFPDASARAQLELVAQLSLELAKAKAELAGMGLDRRSPTQRAAVARIAALEEQIEAERSKLTGTGAHPGSGEPMSDLLLEYQGLEVDRMFAEQFYMNTLSLLEVARQDALKTHRYLAVFVQPGLAQEPTEPRRGWAVLTVLGCTLAAYIILGVIYKTVREHVV